MGSRDDYGEGKRRPKRKRNLLNDAQVRNGRRVVNEGDGGTGTFDRRMANKRRNCGTESRRSDTKRTQGDVRERPDLYTVRLISIQ